MLSPNLIKFLVQLLIISRIDLTSQPPKDAGNCGFMCLCGTLYNEKTYDIVNSLIKFGNGTTIPNNNMCLEDNLSVTKMTLLGTHDSCASLKYRDIFLNANTTLINTPKNTDSDVDTYLIAHTHTH